MERPRWTDERLDERFHSLDRTLSRLEREIRELRVDMNSGFSELRGEMRGEIEGLRVSMYRMFGGLIVALVVSALLQGGI